VAPRLERTGNERERVGTLDRGAGTAQLAPSAKVLAQAKAFDRRHSAGNPSAADQLGALEAKAAKTGKSPRFYKQAPSTQTARLLTVLVEFNPNAGDDFSGFVRPAFVGAEECVTEPAGTLLGGPLHNGIPNPAELGRGTDNNTFWVPDFSPSHYDKLLHHHRPDPAGPARSHRPDGRPGVDLRGYTVKNHYREMSKGAYDITGEVAGWVQVPHSEAWYGAARCGQPPQDNAGHPDNPRQVGQLVVDAVDALAASDPDFPWADYDIEDQGDADGDVRFWAWNNYTIELWDYGFIEVSTDGGSTWTQLEVRDEAGNVVSTNEDPNGRLVDYGGLRNGLTGTTGAEWRHDWVNLTSYAGSTIGLRLRYASDAGFEEPGWFADDFEVTADGTSVWTDDVESGASGWTAEQGTFTDTEGAGWIIISGTFIYQHYYLAEWRNYDGFDKGLRYAYDTTYQNGEFGDEWRVTRTPTTRPACWSGTATPSTP
jgi:Immune inhibitor A peptidase M6